MAFLVCGDFCGESGLRKLGLGGTHPLTQRYMLSKSVSKKELKMILNHVSVGVSNVAWLLFVNQSRVNLVFSKT
ncbi:hypothetical protein [Vibrio vulnificus]|uniref:hypothetical protein n=1 Tax=Vibrio vulnificus TaxID=672 RepID=UPI0039B6F962